MFSIKELEQKKQDIEELTDLPIQDFVGWDGWKFMINSHIEALQKIEELEKENTCSRAGERMSMSVNPYGY